MEHRVLKDHTQTLRNSISYCTFIYMYMLMRAEEGRKEEASKVKQTKQTHVHVHVHVGFFLSSFSSLI